MPTIRQHLESLENYLDDQVWWQNTYWPVWRFRRIYGPRALYMEAKYFVQRGRRGYSDRDLWNADTHIARTVVAFIDKGGKWGVPSRFVKEGEDWEKSEARWRKVEGEIRWLMGEYLEERFTKFDEPAYRARWQRANRLFGKHWMSLWD
jgi:hypothetical protein